MLRLWLLYARISRYWRAFREWLYCLRHGLVPVPFGSTLVHSLKLGNREAIEGPAPAAIFSRHSFMLPLIGVLEPGDVASLVVSNTNGYALPVSACLICVVSDPDDVTGFQISKTVLPFMPAPRAIDPGEQVTMEGRSSATQRMRVERLLVAFPRYVHKRTLQPSPMDGPRG